MNQKIKKTSEKLTKTITETSIKNKKAFSNFGKKVLELMNDNGMIASYLAYSLINLFRPENTSQFKLSKIQLQIGWMTFWKTMV